MSLPYFPMFPSDFEAKTSHLTLAEDGAYNRLLRICWMTPGCTIPTDESWIMRRCRASTKAEKDAVRAILSEFFKVENGRYSNAKLSRIFVDANDAHEKRKNAGAKGGKAKARKENKKEASNALAKPKQPEPKPEPYSKRDTSVSLAQPDGFAEFWEIWPAKLSKQNAQRAWKKLSVENRRTAYAAVRDGWFERWRSAHPDANPIHPATFLNGHRWADEFPPNFKTIPGGQDDRPANKSKSRMDAFIAGASGAS